MIFRFWEYDFPLPNGLDAELCDCRTYEKCSIDTDMVISPTRIRAYMHRLRFVPEEVGMAMHQRLPVEHAHCLVLEHLCDGFFSNLPNSIAS